MNRLPAFVIRALIGIALICALGGSGYSQTIPEFELDHEKGLRANPLGVALEIATRDGRSTYHPSDQITLRLVFSNSSTKHYNLELATHENPAGTSDEFVVDGPADMSSLARFSTSNGSLDVVRAVSRQNFGAVVCCSYHRVPLVSKPVTAQSTEVHLKIPGEYYVFVQTRRMFRNWPQSEKGRYDVVGDLVVTSSNVLHLTIVP
jgi:hypothetical protein